MASDVYNSQENVDFLSALMQEMKSMKTDMKKHAEQIEDLNAKVSSLKEENATLRSPLNKVEKTGTEQLNHLKEENDLLRNQLDESKKKEKGQPQSEKTSFKRPENSHLISSTEEFFESIDPIAHVAVRRPNGEFDEFIFLSPNPKDGEKEIYGCFKKQKSCGDTEDITMDEIEQAIADGHCFGIKGPCYPKTPQEKEGVLSRILTGFSTMASKLISEIGKLISWLLTGFCEIAVNIIKEGWKMLLNIIDGLPIRHLLRVGGCLLATKMVYSFVQEATNAVCKEAIKSLKFYPPPSTAKEASVCMYTKTICKSASKKLGSKGSLSKILKCKKTSSVAKTASKESLKKSVFANFFITGVIEGAVAIYDIHQLGEKGLSKKDYNREFNKTVSGAVGATFGSVGVGMVGQVLCPIPFLGYALGSMVGNYGGRWVASEMAS